MSFFICILFFFQAEDGIRDLVRSRGLGDVYKRQYLDIVIYAGRAAELFALLDKNNIAPKRMKAVHPLSLIHI